jgi:2-polyprenyl-3-methyl-5-hydroxy-6-metoxy-1,4-benzoquinol methylase
MKEQLEIEKESVNGDGLDLAQLMERIRADAEKRKRNSLNFSPPSFSETTSTSLPQLPNALPELKLQPALERREHYKLGDLLGFHDEAFVRNAYAVILKREPDDAGFAEYLGNLRSGRYSKIDILRSLRFSPEGRKANVSIDGLSWWVNLRKAYRIPVVGYLLQLGVEIFRLPVLIANHRRLESHTAAQLERVANHLNEAVVQLSEIEGRHYENNRRLFMTNQGQLEALRNALRLQIESLVNEQANRNREHDLFKTEITTTVASGLNETAEQLRRHSDAQERQSAELLGLRDQLEKRIDVLIEQLQNLKMGIAQQENRLTRLMDDSTEMAASTPRALVVNPEQDHLLDALYVSLEDVLRGAPDEIKEQVKVYLPVLKDAHITSGILDIGCGRGELLEVLRDAGLAAKGIELNRIQVARCQALALDVIETEALAHLRSLPAESLNAVTALHFAEHLPFESLVSFLDEVARVLRPGGLVILETPNPENLLVGSCNFYLDPTHRNPIPIATMELLVQARGFVKSKTMRLHPVADAKIEVKDQLTSHLNHYLYGPMNYAVVARKPSATEPSPEA